jgi:tetratricopeptide (TPR) repeat protein
MDKQNWGAAESLARRALLVFEKHDVSAPRLQVCLNNLGAILRIQNRRLEAEAVLRRALALLEVSHPGSPELAMCLDNLAGLLIESNRSNEGEAMNGRALAILEATLGPLHPAFARSLDGRATFMKLTNPVEAVALCRRAVEILEKHEGGKTEGLRWALNNLACLLRDADQPEDAECLFRRCLALGPVDQDDRDAAAFLSNFGALMHRTGRLLEAEDLFVRALGIADLPSEAGHPVLARCLRRHGSLLAETGRRSEAAAMLRRALLMGTEQLGPDDPEVLECRANLKVLGDENAGKSP